MTDLDEVETPLSPISMVAGPTIVPSHIREVYAARVLSPDIEPSFLQLYTQVQAGVGKLVRAPEDHNVVIMSGEGMLALWAGMKSVFRPGMRVLSISNGIYGAGFASMARDLGGDVKEVSFSPVRGFGSDADLKTFTDAVVDFKPDLVTAVHCDTPTGLLNDLSKIGSVCHEAGALLYVDVVSSTGGANVDVGAWEFDIALLGSQKALSLNADLAIVTLSPRAVAAVNEVSYVGYDALKPWIRSKESLTPVSHADMRPLPYTHNWTALCALDVRLAEIFACDRWAASRNCSANCELCAKGINAMHTTHTDVAKMCRKRGEVLGLKELIEVEEYRSPTVTAFYGKIVCV
eukprot:TRINITY_DN717_c0_g1_i3.p1 TRINITY_DN717_c0_g1~~TRINITY_DN717_c0_g1_i3.p1  ORF type:complete len:362 (-),score=44.18 TRINITY_DN717_c0_g1_i3:111-1154(-)